MVVGLGRILVNKEADRTVAVGVSVVWVQPN